MKELTSVLQTLPARLRSLWADEKRRVQLLAAAGLLGMALLALSEWLPAAPAAQTVQPTVESTAEPYAARLEQQLTELLSAVEGAGRVQVMVTLASEAETIYAEDTDARADGSAARQHVLVNGSAAGLVETVRTPQVLGVAVVCTGGSDPAVQGRITALVQALTDVGANHITVAQMAAQQ